MPRHKAFARNEVAPSWFHNVVQDYISSLRPEFPLRRVSDTVIAVTPAQPLGIAGVPIEGRWRFVTAEVQRTVPGNGSFDIFAVAEDNEIVNAPDPLTDVTDYAFDLRIVTAGTDPSGAGVEVFEKVGTVAVAGGVITELKSLVAPVTGSQLADGAIAGRTGRVTATRQADGSVLLDVATEERRKVGEVKFDAAEDTHHGRWLMFDGIDRSGAEIEAVLGLAAGEANEFVTKFGTGGSSRFGAAAAGKVRIPNAGARVPMVAGSPGGGLTARILGAAGGAERVTLSSLETGVRAHGHGNSFALNDPGHNHNPGSISRQGAFESLGDLYVNAGLSGNAVAMPSGAGILGVMQVWVLSSGTGMWLSGAVADHGGAGALSSHENMPPFLTLGRAFVRV